MYFENFTVYVNYAYFVNFVFEAHMEDWVTKCVASVNKDFTYLPTIPVLVI
jgi:hypothetical protein